MSPPYTKLRNKLKTSLTRKSCVVPIPIHNPGDVWGNVFVPNDPRQMTMPSIHFVSQDGKGVKGVYASFDASSNNISQMTLSNGAPFPSGIKLPLASNVNYHIIEDRDIKWNSDSRTFLGWIHVKEHCGSGFKEKTYSGETVEVSKWRFRFKFDDRYERIMEACKESYYTDSNGQDMYCGSEQHSFCFHDGNMKNAYFNAALLDIGPLHGKEKMTIEDAAYRGITLRQLLNVRDIMIHRCEAEAWKSTHNEQLLKPEDVTLYDLVDNFIKPLTKSSDCSYVELIASKPQPPKWFVSHWWGQPVLNFIMCIQAHARDRNLNLDTVYWICAYANNQHRADEEVGDDPKLCNFYRALELSEGTVSILDRGAICYSRIWCSFELHLSFVQFKKMLYDAYTLGKDKNGDVIAVGLTDGPAAVDRHGVSSQTIRQQNFPVSVCNKALRVELVKSEASYEKDKTRILNFICGETDLNKPPPTHHEKYDEVDRTLRGVFAKSAYRIMLESGARRRKLGNTVNRIMMEMEGKRRKNKMSAIMDGRTILQASYADMVRIRKSLSEAPLSRLEFPFDECHEFRGEAKHFMTSLPKTVEMLNLNYNAVGFERSDEFAVGLHKLKHLTSLKLDLEWNTQLCCVNKLGEEIGCLTRLRDLHLSFWDTKITSCDNLLTTLEKLVNLRRLTLNFYKTSLTDDAILEIWCALVMLDVDLEEVHINLEGIQTAEDGVVQKYLLRDFKSMEQLKTALKEINFY